MGKLGNEIVATYYIEYKGLVRRKFHVYACWDGETPENEYDFYDVYLDDGTGQFCVNEGNPFWELPTRDEVKEFIKDFEV